MEEIKTKKYRSFSIEERNQIALLYLDFHMGRAEIMRKYSINSHSQLDRWINQYREFGTCVDRRGKGTKAEIPNKGRPRKHKVKTEELNREQLIEKVRMYEDIKKSLVYLMKQQSNNIIK
ncbi:MAG: transposase [Tenericutes bacterium]|nr:transposase [Mycoplasmatota bacterium]